jgi:hypothetical protein
MIERGQTVLRHLIEVEENDVYIIHFCLQRCFDTSLVFIYQIYVTFLLSAPPFTGPKTDGTTLDAVFETASTITSALTPATETSKDDVSSVTIAG